MLMHTLIPFELIDRFREICEQNVDEGGGESENAVVRSVVVNQLVDPRRDADLLLNKPAHLFGRDPLLRLQSLLLNQPLALLLRSVEYRLQFSEPKTDAVHDALRRVSCNTKTDFN